MKNLLLIILLGVSIQTFAQQGKGPEFSAFTSEGVLHVTVLGDSCNHVMGSLEVDGLCLNDRKTRNFAITCDVDLSIASTRMACPDNLKVPRVVSVNLNEANVAREAKVLNLTYGSQTIRVPVNK